MCINMKSAHNLNQCFKKLRRILNIKCMKRVHILVRAPESGGGQLAVVSISEMFLQSLVTHVLLAT